jgi:hypothetical protein
LLGKKFHVLGNISASKTTQCLTKKHLNNISFGKCKPLTDWNKTSIFLPVDVQYKYNDSKQVVIRKFTILFTDLSAA